MSVTLTDEQRERICEVIEIHADLLTEERFFDRIAFPEMADGISRLGRLWAFATGTAPLEPRDRQHLIDALLVDHQESAEEALGDEGRLPRLEAGDVDLIYCHSSLEESVVTLRGYIDRSRRDAAAALGVLNKLGVEPDLVSA